PYDIHCEQPRTVLDAIKTLDKYKKMFKDAYENVIIQRGTGDDESIVPTHFPCSCIRDEDVLTISGTKKQIEKATDVREVHPRDYYSVFYIDTNGGLNVTSTKLFRNKTVEKFKYLCVYGEKEISVKEALNRDGRFIDELGYFELMNINDKHKIVCTDNIKNLHNKKFKICRPRKANTETNQQAMPGQQKQQILPHASTNAEHTKETGSVLAVAHQKGISLKTAEKEIISHFPNLKQLMESRFPGETFQEELNLRKENFGKIQQSFSQVHRVRKLLELGKSVCKVVVKDVSVGTGFVLFDTFILTSAHLFKGYVEGKKLQQDVEVFAIFDYEEPEPVTKFYYFRAENTFTDFDADLDYAVLELNPEGSKPNHEFGPLPANGEACIIGHPAGGVKEMDPTFIIETDKRGQAAAEYLSQYKHPLIINSLSDHVKKQSITNILQGGHKAGKVGTYHTFMYHGASGSPVFDGLGRVFGLHTAGFTYGFRKEVESVIEHESVVEVSGHKPAYSKVRHYLLNYFQNVPDWT
uniref:Serine protease n=1 Tax=Oreochromis aureus TaxID=47969 RepID=A0A668VLQ8_OREAU